MIQLDASVSFQILLDLGRTSQRQWKASWESAYFACFGLLIIYTVEFISHSFFTPAENFFLMSVGLLPKLLIVPTPPTCEDVNFLELFTINTT